jgi:hypothetical protein
MTGVGSQSNKKIKLITTTDLFIFSVAYSKQSPSCYFIFVAYDLFPFFPNFLHLKDEGNFEQQHVLSVFLELTLSKPIFLPTAYSPALICFWAVKRLVDYL